MGENYTIHENQWTPLSTILGRTLSAPLVKQCLDEADSKSERLKRDLRLRALPLTVQNRAEGLSLRVSSISGTLQIFGRQVSVAPKFVQTKEAEKEWQESVLVMLNRARRKQFTFTRLRKLALQHATFIDHVAAAYADSLRRALSQEPIHAYRRREVSSTALRGRLAIDRQLRRLIQRPDRLECDVDYLDTDNQFNHLLRWAVQRFSIYVFDSSVRKELSFAASLLPPIAGNPRLPAHLPLFPPPQYDVFREPLEIASMLARGYAHGQRSGAYTGYGYLLNMERLFESFVEKTLKRLALSGRLERYKVAAQETRLYAIPRHSPGKRYFTKPDNVLYREGSPVLLVDAKYKKFSEAEMSGLQPQNADIYQAFASLVSHGCDKALLVYPLMRDDVELREGTLKVWEIPAFAGTCLIGAVSVDISRLASAKELANLDAHVADIVEAFVSEK